MDEWVEKDYRCVLEGCEVGGEIDKVQLVYRRERSGKNDRFVVFLDLGIRVWEENGVVVRVGLGIKRLLCDPIR